MRSYTEILTDVMAKVSFRTNVLLKSIIGKDLITDDNLAVLELVKNSFDSGSNKVNLVFENLIEGSSSLIISDFGSGMSQDDLINKWLNIAYSEKKNKKEEYGRILAGNKGVGRFSCDRLGRYLTIYTRKRNADYLKLYIDWSWFEEVEDINLNIQDVEIELIKIQEEEFVKNTGFKPFQSGTLLEISNLRERWTHSKILSLKNQLERLINPNQTFKSTIFDINIEAKDYLNDEKDYEDHKKVNGLVRNKIFEKLAFKVTSIQSKISRDGKHIISILKDRGISIFTLVEKNPFPLLRGIRIFIYYLNPYSKAYFTKQTGIRSVDFGSIFLFINGFRIPPYGDYGNDWLGMESRKGQAYARHLGTREVVGRIEIEDKQEVFKIVSSRAGVVSNEHFSQLTKSDSPYGYYYKIFRRLERFVSEGIKWDSTVENEKKLEQKILSDPNWDESKESYVEDSFTRNTRIVSVIENILNTKKEEVIRLHVNKLLISDLIEEKTLKIESDLNEIAEQVKEKKLTPDDLSRFMLKIDESRKDFLSFSDIVSIYNDDPDKIGATERIILEKYNDLSSEKESLENELQKEREARQEAEGKVDEIVSENLFLKSVRSQDLEEVISFLHHIGLGAKNIDNELKLFVKRLRKGKEIDKKELVNTLESILLENRKILTISKFASKANFRLYTESVEVDIVEYISEYIENILGLVSSQSPKISVVRQKETVFIKEVKPIELNIIIDNLISNSRRAGATEVVISFGIKDKTLEISFKDNGNGIDRNKRNKIFELGYTTTSGSGIGLYHVSKIMNDMGGSISLNHRNKNFTEFLISINN